MRSLGHRALSVVFLTALLLAPLAASSHQHADHAAARSCATCVVAHRSPALQAAGPALPSVVLRSVALLAEDTAPRPRLATPARTGRAPPLRSSTALA
jgi:hypothetical protein